MKPFAIFSRKFIKPMSALLSVALVLSLLPGFASPAAHAAAGASSAAFQAVDTDTKGAWNGKYGRDGYILFGYGATAATPGEDAGIFKKIALYDSDIVSKPAYLDEIDGHAYRLRQDARVYVNTSVAADRKVETLDPPAASGLPQVDGKVIYNNDSTDELKEFEFHLNDDRYHYFTVYGNDYLKYNHFALNDLNGNTLVPVFTGGDKGVNHLGSYITFKVKGSFVFAMTGDWNHGIAGAFFDPVPGAGGEAQNIAKFGSFVATVMSPTGQGNKDLEVIRDGVKPKIGSGDNSTQFDTYNNNAGPDEQYYGYTFGANVDFTQLVYQTGNIFLDGGWFKNGSLKVQVRVNGAWTDVPAAVSPAYPNSDAPADFGSSYQTYTFTLDHVQGDGIRLYGTVGGAGRFISIGELEAWAVVPDGTVLNPPPTQAAEAVAEYLGADVATQGHWNGKYGGDGYVLFGYSGSAQGANPLKSSDLARLPAYLGDYNLAWGGVYWQDSGTSESASVLDMPAGNGSPKYNVYASRDDGSFKTEFSFAVKDDEEHLYSFYSNRGDSAVNSVKFDILSAGDQVVCSQTVGKSVFQNGGYVTFAIRGSFKLRVETKPGFGLDGFFFDSPAPDTAAGISAEIYQKSRVKLAWSNSGQPERILIERSGDHVHFAVLASVDKTDAAYTDADVMTGQTYYYRLRYQSGVLYGQATPSVQVDVPSMTATALSLQQSDIRINQNEQVTLSAKLEKVNADATRAPLAGKTVAFRLHGEHVGDGVTFGQEISGDLGSAVTDGNGIATVTFASEYTGPYTVTAAFAQDVADELNGAQSAPVALAVAPLAWAAAPVILKVSDAIAAGDSLSINGYGFDKDTVEIAVARAAAEAPPAEPPTGALYPQIAQTDKGGSFVVAKMPSGAAPGVYNVWVKNGYGWSKPFPMNAARPLFMSEYEAFNGLDVEVAGRNFDQSEFGGTTATKVRLNDGNGKTFEMPTKELNPYHVTFTVGQQELGTYFVEVSNDDGINWARLDNGQKLTLVPAGDDPLHLGVAWAKDFKWSRVYNVADYGATPNDPGDVTAQVQAAVDAAEQAGGGVVYFPNGSYNIKQIKIGSGVVLEGQDEYGTKLVYTGSGGNFIDTKGDGSLGGVAQLQGIAHLSLLLSDPQVRPDTFIWFGQPWGDAFGNVALRNANRLFCVGVNIDYPYDNKGASGTGRGIGFLFIGRERVVMKDNHFVGWNANNLITAMSQYFTLKNNYFEYATGYVHGMSTYSFYENNKVIIHPEFNQDSHGLFARADAYIANNYVQGAGSGANDTNDGEGICVEGPGSLFGAGAVLKATPTSLQAAPLTPLSPEMALQFGELSVVITDGRGLGQMRRVASVDASAGTIHVDKPFDITPDSSSRYTLITPLENFTVYKNTLVDNAKGIWPFGNNYDGLIADNTMIDTRGIFLYAVSGAEGFSMDYFVRAARNSVEGISRRGNVAGIGIGTGRWGNNGDFMGVQTYGTEFRDNSIVGDNTAVFGNEVNFGAEVPPLSGIYVSSYGFSTQSNGTGTGDTTNTLIEGNRLSNLKSGVTLTIQNYGQYISRNHYDASVLQFLKDSGSDNTLVTADNEQAAQADTALSLSVPPAVKGASVSLSATLLSNGAPVAGQTVAFAVNGTAAGTAVTSENGVATLAYTADLEPGTYAATAAFAGTSRLAAANAAGSLAVTAALTQVVNAPTPTSSPSSVTTIPPSPAAAPSHVAVAAGAGRSGHVAVEVAAADLQAAIATAADRTVTVDVQGAESARSIAVKVPLQDLLAAKGKVERIALATGLAKVTLATNALRGAEAGASPTAAELSVALVDPATLSAEAAHAIGSRPVYDFNLTVDGKKISGFDRGDVTVRVKYDLKPGEAAHKVVLYSIDGNGKPRAVPNGRFDRTANAVTFRPAHFSQYAAAYREVSFADLSSIAWAKPSIEALQARDIVSGTGNGLFEPSRQVTRGEFITMLMNALELNDASAPGGGFKDVKAGNWYSAAIASARRLGIVQGRPDGTFGVNDKITRVEMAVMADSAIRQAAAYGSGAETGTEMAPAPETAQAFQDRSAIAAYAREAVDRLHLAGVIQGTGSGNFAPAGLTTRAEAAALIWRLLATVK